MKSHALYLTTALMALCGCSQTQQTATTHASDYRQSEAFTEFIGLEIWNHQDEKLGVVKHITADLENARLVEVIVTTSTGSWSSKRSRTTAVPPRALTLDAAKHVMRLNVSKARFDAAPEFNSSNIAASSTRERVAEVIRYFGLEPWFFLEGQTVRKNAEILRLGYVQTTDQILHLPIKNTKGEYIGEVRTLMMDLPKGHIVHVDVLTDALAGKRSVIQPRALRYNAAHNGLVLDSTLTELAGEPHLRWLDGDNKAFQQESYVNREVKADGGLHSKQNAQEGIVGRATPMEQGQNFRDEQKTSRIKQAIQDDPSLSANAKNEEVVTLNAQTTLRGHVNTAEGKQRIGEIAAKAGRPENVSNLLEVKPLR